MVVLASIMLINFNNRINILDYLNMLWTIKNCSGTTEGSNRYQESASEATSIEKKFCRYPCSVSDTHIGFSADQPPDPGPDPDPRVLMPKK